MQGLARALHFLQPRKAPLKLQGGMKPAFVPHSEIPCGNARQGLRVRKQHFVE